jgi:hypothetical protein
MKIQYFALERRGRGGRERRDRVTPVYHTTNRSPAVQWFQNVERRRSDQRREIRDMRQEI